LVRADQCLAQTDNAIPSATIITLVALDLGTSTTTNSNGTITQPLTQARCFVGGTEAFYMSERNLYLATTRYDYASASGMPRYAPRTSTDIHQFGLDGLQISYKGSGNVMGHLGLTKTASHSEWGNTTGTCASSRRPNPRLACGPLQWMWLSRQPL
jgi:hypothetical protein